MAHIDKFKIAAPFLGLPVRMLDFETIATLSDEDFAKFYLEVMEEYRKDKWWKDERHIPHCLACGETIDGPADLRRYVGRSYHAACFRDFHEANRNSGEFSRKSKNEQAYWSRVASLVISG